MPDQNDDLSWRLKTLYGIYRRIITYMRRNDIAQQISSIGLLAYAKSFKAIWLETYPNDDKDGSRRIPVFHDTEMRESIGAAEVRMRFKLQRRSEQNATFRTLAFGVVGVIFSLVGILRLSSTPTIAVPPAPYFQLAATWLLKYPLQILMPMVVVIYLASVAIPRYFRPQHWGFFKTLLALAQAYERYKVVAAFWLVAGIFLGIGIVVIVG